MDTNTGESPGHQSQSQQLGNSPSEEEMGHWAPTGVEPKDYDDDCFGSRTTVRELLFYTFKFLNPVRMGT